MKDDTHPEYYQATITCGGCGAVYNIGATVKTMSVNVCAACHPFFTGKQRFVDSERRIDKFKAKYAKFQKSEGQPKA